MAPLLVCRVDDCGSAARAAMVTLLNVWLKVRDTANASEGVQEQSAHPTASLWNHCDVEGCSVLQLCRCALVHRHLVVKPFPALQCCSH